MLLKAATIALIPALVIQGRRVKKNTLRLPEPEGLREGQTGTGKPLSILIVGDSAAAGVGVDTQQDALLGAVIDALKMDYAIDWKLHAKSGDGTGQIIKNIKTLQNRHYDVVLTSVGVNDVTKLMPAKVWMKKQHDLYRLIQQKFSPKLVIAAGVPPMQMFPALPNPLSWLFGQYAKQMNAELAKLVKARANMQWIEYDMPKYQALNLEMAADGFHPSKEIYQIWGQTAAEMIRQHN
ncbi:lipase [Acinetobacter sp. ANC 5054]|uniref:SGNH/GDSL hydrolase family protein n=1 Tax=Acinetobacter sp. ANC 5054 TaxID=1977877 RepID=UPI000A356CB4|nr:SGNH/GDSL hydrolase family protein [Acinetobacter sp. ANC 5054]OTG79468.1 lipase [Acinetobacter sp. ANC 5054]